MKERIDRQATTDITDDDRRAFSIKGGFIYKHKRLQSHYTTYDLRREYDSINPKSITRDIMVVADDDDEKQMEVSPFWYARVLGIFHVHVVWRPGNLKERINFIWVRWFGREEGRKFGDKGLKLEKIGFVTEEDDTPSFGFLDPRSIVRAIHLVPDFNSGRTDNGLESPTLARVGKNDINHNDDWAYFYVNKCDTSPIPPATVP